MRAASRFRSSCAAAISFVQLTVCTDTRSLRMRCGGNGSSAGKHASHGTVTIEHSSPPRSMATSRNGHSGLRVLYVARGARHPKLAATRISILILSLILSTSRDGHVCKCLPRPSTCVLRICERCLRRSRLAICRVSLFRQAKRKISQKNTLF